MSIFLKNDLPAAEERQIRPDAGIVAAELIRCRWLLLIGLLISAMLSYVFVTETYKEEYSSTATFFVTSKGSVTSTVFTNIETAKSLTEAFQYLLESDAMRRTVLDAIGETEFSGTITTSQLPETNIMSLTVTSDSPGLTFKIIRAVINNHHLITDNVMSNAAMDVLMQPTVPKAPTRALNRRSGVIKYTAILFAVIVSATVVYIIFSDKVRSERDLSALLPSCERLSTFGCEKHRRTLRSRLRRGRSAKKAASESLLVSNPTTSFGYAETFRLLRTRVEYLLNKNGQKTLLIASVAEGEGKTITAANLAVMLSYAGNKVLLIDGNCDTNGNPGLSKLFDITPKDEDCLCARLETGNVSGLPSPEGAKHLRLLPNNDFSGDAADIIVSEKMNKLIRAAREQYDFIIIDTPALCRSGLAEYYAELSDCAVMVVRQGVASGRSIRDAVDTLSGSTQILGCILNDVRKVGFLSGLLSGGYGRQYGYGKYYSKYGYGDYGKYGYGGYGSRGSSENNGGGKRQ